MWSGSIKMVLKNILKELVWIISEFEALTAKPNDKILFRRLYLRLMNVTYKKGSSCKSVGNLMS
jgi:hypothetical protein